MYVRCRNNFKIKKKYCEQATHFLQKPTQNIPYICEVWKREPRSEKNISETFELFSTFWTEIAMTQSRGLSVSTVTASMTSLSSVLDVLINSPNRKVPLSRMNEIYRHVEVVLYAKATTSIRTVVFIICS